MLLARDHYSLQTTIVATGYLKYDVSKHTSQIGKPKPDDSSPSDINAEYEPG